MPFSQVGIELRTEFHTQSHSLGILGIRADDSREVTVDDHLLGHHMDVLEAPAAQSHRDDDAASTVHRRIDNVEVLLAQDDVLVDHSLLDSLDIVPVHLTADGDDEVFVTLELDVLNLNLVHLVDDALIMRSQHLCSIVPVGLIAIVFARIVRCRHIDTSLTTKLTDGKRDLRRGTQTLEEIDLDAVSREDVSHTFGKHPAVITAVMTHDHSGLDVGEGFVDVVGKALCGHAHDVLVHTVRACTHNAAQTTRTELQVLVEGIDEGALVLIVEHCLNFLACLLVKGRSKPLLCQCLALCDKLSVVFHKQSCFKLLFDYVIFDAQRYK